MIRRIKQFIDTLIFCDAWGVHKWRLDLELTKRLECEGAYVCQTCGERKITHNTLTQAAESLRTAEKLLAKAQVYTRAFDLSDAAIDNMEELRYQLRHASIDLMSLYQIKISRTKGL